MDGQVFWITGLSGAGKTTIGTRLYYRLKQQYTQIVLLDGDVVKRLFGPDKVDYSMEGRRRRAFQYAELCRLLSSQGITVICCTIAMFDEVRAWNRRYMENYYEIFIDTDLSVIKHNDSKGLYETESMVGVKSDAELPKNSDVIIKNSMDNNIEAYVEHILSDVDKIKGSKTDTPESYWNKYYGGGKAPEPPSDFAGFAYKYMEQGRKLIDLGCGNGRDSVYFHHNGLKVTAVDSSPDAIEIINTKSLPIFAVCDDFVTAKALFCVDYDYCYARWSIHAITKAQQDELLPGVYGALKKDGLFFMEARTVNDVKYGKGDRLGEDEYFFDGHYRRFLRPGLLAEQLKGIGFDIVYFEESDAFSVVGGDSPSLIRIIAKK